MSVRRWLALSAGRQRGQHNAHRGRLLRGRLERQLRGLAAARRHHRLLGGLDDPPGERVRVLRGGPAGSPGHPGMVAQRVSDKWTLSDTGRAKGCIPYG